MTGLSAFDIAQHFVGVKEIPGQLSHPFISYCHSTTHGDGNSDEIPWCSSFVNGIAEICGLPRSMSRLARSWLTVGREIPLADARAGWDIVILKRGEAWQGHVGWFAGWYPTQGLISVLGGNQGDKVCIESFPESELIEIRRLA